jgi:hypothetical protein
VQGIKVVTLNIRHINRKTELINELKGKKMNILMGTEAEKKIYWTQNIGLYTMIYSRVGKAGKTTK